MRAVIYARVSTEEQGDNYSLPSQVDACRRYAADRGMQVVADVQDIASGATLDRAGLTRIRELAHKRAIDAVIVYANDRLTRNVAHMLLLRDEFLNAGVAFHSVTRGQAQDTPEGRMFDTLESAFAEYERLKIKERMQRGKRQKAASGQIVGEGSAPYGYRWQGNGRERRLVIVPEEAEIVKMIFAWSIEGDGIPRIVERLVALNIPPPSQAASANKSRRIPERWSTSGVGSVLSNPTYTGKVEQYGQTITVPAIIDEATYTAAREAARKRQQFSRRNAKRNYLLRGRLRCAVSGYAMCGDVSGTPPVVRYHVNCRDKTRPAGRFSIRASLLEPAVWQWVVSLLDEETIRSAIAEAREAAAEQIAERDRQRAALLAAREDVQRQIDRLLDGYARGLIDEETLTRNLEPRKRQIASINAELERLTNAGEGAPDAATEAALIETARAIRAKLIDPDALSVEEKQAILDALDVQVRVERVGRGQYIAHCTATLFDASSAIRIASANSRA
ncbi:recombinase family protein [Roseiflexus sp.]